MTSNDDDRPGDDGVYRSKPNRRPAVTRRVRIAAGVTGLAALLGGGAYLITDRDGSAPTQDVGALAPVAPAAPGEASAVLSPSVATTSASPTPATTSVTPSAAPAASPKRSSDAPAVREQIQAARDAAAKDGFPLQRPLPQKGKMVAESQVSTRTEQTSEGTIRISTARADLSGQDDQLLAADNGTAVGHARCTDKVRFSAGAASRAVPSLLLCWRTSAKRSVVTLAVAKKGSPSAAASAITIDREWSKLG